VIQNGMDAQTSHPRLVEQLTSFELERRRQQVLDSIALIANRPRSPMAEPQMGRAVPIAQQLLELGVITSDVAKRLPASMDKWTVTELITIVVEIRKKLLQRLPLTPGEQRVLDLHPVRLAVERARRALRELLRFLAQATLAARPVLLHIEPDGGDSSAGPPPEIRHRVVCLVSAGAPPVAAFRTERDRVATAPPAEALAA
jgi:hypothetical protein